MSVAAAVDVFVFIFKKRIFIAFFVQYLAVLQTKDLQGSRTCLWLSYMYI